MFGLDAKTLGQVAELAAKLEATGGEFLLELRRLNDNLEALRRDGVQIKPPA
jgi:hypothetical protein